MSECPFSFLVFLIVCLSQVANFFMCQNCCFHEQRIWFKKGKKNGGTLLCSFTLFFFFLMMPWNSQTCLTKHLREQGKHRGFLFLKFKFVRNIKVIKTNIYYLYYTYLYTRLYNYHSLKWIQMQRQFNEYNMGKNAQWFWEKLNERFCSSILDTVIS